MYCNDLLFTVRYGARFRFHFNLLTINQRQYFSCKIVIEILSDWPVQKNLHYILYKVRV